MADMNRRVSDQSECSLSGHKEDELLSAFGKGLKTILKGSDPSLWIAVLAQSNKPS